MADILQQIIADKRLEVEALKAAQPDFGPRTRPYHSMRRALASSATGIIAEFKRRSPSKGWINRDACAGVVPAGYEKAGAAALSVLTDKPYFGGDISDLETVASMVSIPILRKDFIIDEIQIAQAQAAGADAVLLIAAALGEDECARLAAAAHSRGLETLLEIHTADELRYTGADIDMIGVNNRHLGTFDTDTQTSFAIAAQLPADAVLVSESGISDPQTVARLRDAGFRGFLIGETFMKTADPAATLHHFINQIGR